MFKLVREQKDRISGAEREKMINIRLVCLIIVLVASLPLFTDFLLNGTKLSYQLIRIEALKNGLQQYGLHLWAKPEWIQPLGLSFAFYYGDTFLYIPAVLNLLGFSVMASYRIFLIIINIATVAVSYHVFCKMFQNEYVGVLGAALYSASVYRMFLMYGEAELGEIIALVFLPLVLYGCYLIFMKQDSKWAYIWMVIGLTGMLRSHVLSTCIALLFVLIIALIHIKQYKCKYAWIQTALVFASLVLFNLNYLYTMYRYTTCGIYLLNPLEGQMIQSKGIHLAQLFMCFYQAGGSHEFGTTGIIDAVPVGLGVSLFAGALVFLYLLFVYGDMYERKVKTNGYKAFFVGLAACYLGALCFPWDRIFKLGNGMANIISMMQEPWHFLQIGLIAFSALACIVYGMIKEKNASYSKIYGVVLVVSTLLFSSYLVANMLFTYDFVRVNTAEEIPYGEIAGMGVQVEMMHTSWYLCTAIAVLAVVATIVKYVWDRKSVRNEK